MHVGCDDVWIPSLVSGPEFDCSKLRGTVPTAGHPLRSNSAPINNIFTVGSKVHRIHFDMFRSTLRSSTQTVRSVRLVKLHLNLQGLNEHKSND